MANQVFQVNCKSCNGMFVTENVQSSPMLRCPHCRSEAPPRQFHYMPVNDPFEAPQEGMPALLSAIESVDEETSEENAAHREAEPFRLKGKWLHFDCPHCQWPLRIKALDAQSSLIDCGHCGLEIIPPDPETGSRAELTRASQQQANQISTNDMRSVRLGKDNLTGNFPVARAKDKPSNPDPAAEDKNIAMRGGSRGKTGEVPPSAPTPKAPKTREPAPVPQKRSVKPLAAEQLGRAFTPFENQTIIGGPSFELSEEEQTDTEKHSRLNHARIFRYILITAIVILSGIAFLVNSRLKDGKNASAAHGKDIEKKVAIATAEQERLQSMFDTAKNLASSDDWRAFLPMLRHRHRVEPIIEAYYAENKHVPVELVSFEKPVSIEIDGSKYEQMSVVTSEGDKRIIGFQHASEGITFDWEVFVDIADWEWANFKETKPTEFTPIRVVAMRTSADDTYYRDANFTREEAMAVRIWLRNRADSFIALMPKESPIGQQVDHECKWEIGKLIIADIAFPPADETHLTDRLLLRRIVQDRWLYSVKD